MIRNSVIWSVLSSSSMYLVPLTYQTGLIPGDKRWISLPRWVCVSLRGDRQLCTITYSMTSEKMKCVGRCKQCWGTGDGSTESLGLWGPCQTSRRDALSDVLEDKSKFSRKGSGALKAVHKEGIISTCAELHSYESVASVDSNKRGRTVRVPMR